MQQTESIVLAGGCFWCVESVFEQVKGVVATECGYSNGQDGIKPSYELVKSGTTGYAEVVKLSFIAQQITLADILAIFFTIHDCTQANGQGQDIGSQYRSAIYYCNPAQLPVIEQVLAEVAKQIVPPQAVVTEVAALKNYVSAEEMHQHYFLKNPQNQYCQLVAAPKIEKFRQIFQHYCK